MIRSLAKKSLSAVVANRAGNTATMLRPRSLDFFLQSVSHHGYVDVSAIRQPGFRQLRWMTTEGIDDAANAKEQLPLVYESPLGSVVAKLRTVSLMTAIIGSTGVPCMIAIKGAVPELGMLAVAMTFVAGSIGSTAAIHFVFSPYVYRIESIPVRQCSYQPKQERWVEMGSDIPAAIPGKKVTLLKAWTRSLFLRSNDIVFDPEIDVEPYSGLRPLCNFRAKGLPLYVHPGRFILRIPLRTFAIDWLFLKQLLLTTLSPR